MHAINAKTNGYMKDFPNHYKNQVPEQQKKQSPKNQKTNNTNKKHKKKHQKTQNTKATNFPEVLGRSLDPWISGRLPDFFFLVLFVFFLGGIGFSVFSDSAFPTIKDFSFSRVSQ